MVLSSSRPSAPCTTQARSWPRLFRTWARGSTHSLAKTPISCRLTPAGLDSGPSRLKIVRVPNSTRVGATWRMALWCRGAIRKQVPASLKARSSSFRSASMLTPRAARTSAAPVFDDSARLPCLATGTPQAATTNWAPVETFSVPLASPPVPQVSIAPAGASTGSILARMVRTAPVISATVSPRTRSAIRKPPICDGVASPDIMMPKAASACSSVSRPPLAA